MQHRFEVLNCLSLLLFPWSANPRSRLRVALTRSSELQSTSQACGWWISFSPHLWATNAFFMNRITALFTISQSPISPLLVVTSSSNIPRSFRSQMSTTCKNMKTLSATRWYRLIVCKQYPDATPKFREHLKDFQALVRNLCPVLKTPLCCHSKVLHCIGCLQHFFKRRPSRVLSV
jgi:hypothetical protein